MPQVKPGNILVDEAPGGGLAFKLADFGGVINHDGEEEIFSVGGTDMYNAPEKQADIRCAALVIVQCLGHAEVCYGLSSA